MWRGRGNCWTACVASILEVSIDDLQPLQDVYVHQSQIALDGGAWDETPLLAALRQLGYTAIGFPPEMQPSGLAIAEGFRERGLKVVEIEVSELRKMDGGLTCLSLRFEYL